MPRTDNSWILFFFFHFLLFSFPSKIVTNLPLILKYSTYTTLAALTLIILFSEMLKISYLEYFFLRIVHENIGSSEYSICWNEDFKIN
jgi:hypothetical protein